MSTHKNPVISTELASAIKMLGDAWSLRILYVLSDRPMRFNELSREVSDICPVTLTNRLKKLRTAKMITRREETVDKLSVVYELTDKGRAIQPIVNEMNKFGEKFL